MAKPDTEKDLIKAAAGRLGAAIRARKLSGDRKSEIARTAALARWSGDIPRATNEGILKIGDIEIECANLEGGTRVINQESFLRAIGRSRSPKAGTGSASVDVDDMPPFLAAENLKPFITAELQQSTTPMLYRTINGARGFGYNALLLPQVCDVYLRLKHEGKPTHNQEHVIRAAYTLMRALAHTGILALVDKATGFDQEEEKREMLLIVQKYVAPELQPWLSKFPPEFFRELRRLREVPDSTSTKNPRYFGRLINKYIYEPLPPGVMDEIKRKNPPIYDQGRRRYKNYQWLTGETGIPHLDDQIKMVTMLMRVSDSWEQFETMFERAFAKQKKLPFVALSMLGPFRKEELPGDDVDYGDTQE